MLSSKLNLALVVVAIGLAFTVGAQGQGGAASDRVFRIQYMPHPRDMVQIEEGTPFLVPPEKLFVLTVLGNADGTNNSAVHLRVDGVSRAAADPGYPMREFPPGCTARSATTITLTNVGTNPNDCVAWGYLADK